MRAGGIGMVFDRALTPELLDVALRVATEHGGAPDARRLLTVALKDYVSAQEAGGKTKKCLTRVWVSPPPPARLMIQWAIGQQSTPDPSTLHFGAILATFPFAGAAAAIVGRHLHLDAKVDPIQVKAEMRALLGDRSTVDVGTRKVLTTMRYLGLLDGPDGGPFVIGRQPMVAPEFTGWLLHALLLTRQVESVAVGDISRAHELATLKVDSASLPYPLIEMHTENGQSVAAVRNGDG